MDPRIGFIGAGRLGKALAWRLASRGLAVVAVASHSEASAQALAARIPGCHVVSPQSVVDACDLVFVTTPDSAIATTVSACHWRDGVAVVHCSGVTEVAMLDAARQQGALAGGFHPMQTFGDPDVAARTLAGCTITIEAPQPLDALLVALAERLECRVNRLPPGMRARYHAAAGYVSQFINVLFDEAAGLWSTWGADEAQAVQALLPLARGTLEAIGGAGIARAMPGPVSRGDLGSIEKHLNALEPLEPQEPEASDTRAELYRALCAATVRIASRSGAIDAATAQRFDELLARGKPAADAARL
jgi:predicted short-subunit dehydrogenase-like oxidoreductase (DUF2520 family)